MGGGPRGPRGMGPRHPLDKQALKRLLGYLKPYRLRLAAVLLCVILNAVATARAATFLGTVIDDYITPLLGTANPDFSGLLSAILRMAALYGLAIVATYTQARIMAVISQSVLRKVRDEMFDHMQTLPIRYFDTHTHGEVMSHYTNDTDTLRQMVSQVLPQSVSSFITLAVVFHSMMGCSVWLTLLLMVGTFFMLKATMKIGKGSAKYFVRQQTSLASLNGYVEEMVNGQKVVKVFNHEPEAKEEFDRRNDELTENATEANKLGNILGPVNNNMGHLLYVVLAIAGGALAIGGLTNLSFKLIDVFSAGQGMIIRFFQVSLSPLTLGSIVAFLTLTRSFMMPINQMAQQINFIAMAVAGAGRIFALMDEKPEEDQGYVRLVNAKEENGQLTETDEHTGIWAWKHPHSADGSVTYTKLAGDVVMEHVDFAYDPEKPVLHDITLYARPGQKVAFVGATGAGKTTITNLINRFYDIADGKIRYDGININKIHKPDLRRSLGVVLQDVNLFTGTVMDNIRYGKLDATDEECIAAAKLANADDFITRLPDGYNTMLKGDGSGLSQGQRQLISIARAAVADPPVMILDEATSSIDTRTEALVQRGMDKLMEGRTVFVIAHRLSTVQNSDVIMVLDHGRIIERGSHDQLIAEKGQYYQLYTGAFELE
ncbi:MAG: ABC transporter ATP-binding protein/permease [Clostridiales bacterium]|nr:ABC transporter ATP-binding protein/permease [Clostridiales bacterium]